MIEGFLLGIIVCASLVSGVFFWKFWFRTRDPLFMAFAVAFILEGLNRTLFLLVAKPNEGEPMIYVIRLVAFLIILTAILWKNRRRQNP